MSAVSEPVSADPFGGFYRGQLAKLVADVYARPPLYFDSPEGRAKLAALNAEREARLTVELAAAQQEWRDRSASSQDNPPILRVLEIHQPERQSRGIGCSECCESDGDDTVAVEWPCVTYRAIKGEI